ncbi:MAG: winged helix-turn-helix domain-containing protein [Burkholderiales bacterium]|jgi:DNA-binding transcriptional regulator YhcF (GntR family)|nr:winged helix-turn-helix domain-containing protein [Burkholderiales bacterium]
MSERGRRNGVLSLVGRIEAWVRLQVLNGARPAGARLPTPETLARWFDANPNTVREAYARLAARGVVDVRHGSGVYVRESVSADRARAIAAFLEDTMRRGRELGVPPADVASSLWAVSTEHGGDRTVWWIDRPHPYLSSFLDTLRSSFDGPVKLIELSELDAAVSGGTGPRAGDLVLTRFRFVRDVRARLGAPVDTVYPIRTRADVKSMMALATYLPEQRLGCVCISDPFARAMGRSIRRQGVPLEQCYGVVEDAASVEEVFRDSDIVVTSCAGLARLEPYRHEPWFRPPQVVVFEIDPASIEAVLALVADSHRAVRMAA